MTAQTKKVQTARRKIRAFLNEQKNRPCKDCRKKYDPVCMDFDHVRGKKIFALREVYSKRYAHEKVVREIAKCDVVCANCHRLRTKKRRSVS